MKTGHVKMTYTEENPMIDEKEHDFSDEQLRQLMPSMGNVTWAEAFLVRKLVYYWVGRYQRVGKKAGLDREDLAQLAWIQALEACKQERTSTLSTVVSRWVKFHLSTATRSDLKEDELEDDHDQKPESDELPAFYFDEKEALVEAMKKLTKDERYIIRSYYWHGLQFHDIRRRMKWSEPMLYRTLAQAKKKLRQLISPSATN